jgi:galactose mutarotase-like enzyme
MIILKNHCLTAKISSIGAELIELGRNDKNSVLWKMDNLFWNRISPILFPIVGRLLDDSYEHSEQIYRMKQHGFARDLPFRIIEQTQSKVELELTDSDDDVVPPWERVMLLINKWSNKEDLTSDKGKIVTVENIFEKKIL